MNARLADGPIIDLGRRVALVTGAGQGVGQQVALDLARHGAGTVVVNDVDGARAETVADEVRVAGAEAIAVRCDVTDHDAVAAMCADVRTQAGPIGVLVNNAGNQGAGGKAPPARPFWEQTPDDWAPSLGVNLHGVLHCSRHVLGQMVDAGYGRVVTVISDAGRVGEIGGLEVYSAAKAGAAGLTRALARAGGRHGITANCVALGAIRTPATDEFIGDEARTKQILRPYVVRRVGEPQDPAGLVTYLASEATSWVTGQTFPVNGGYSLAL